MIDVEPCPSCDFIGPLGAPEQFAMDLHRALHRAWQSLQPVIQAFRDITPAAEHTRVEFDSIPPEPTQETPK